MSHGALSSSSSFFSVLPGCPLRRRLRRYRWAAALGAAPGRVKMKGPWPGTTPSATALHRVDAPDGSLEPPGVANFINMIDATVAETSPASQMGGIGGRWTAEEQLGAVPVLVLAGQPVHTSAGLGGEAKFLEEGKRCGVRPSGGDGRRDVQQAHSGGDDWVPAGCSDEDAGGAKL